MPKSDWLDYWLDECLHRRPTDARNAPKVPHHSRKRKVLIIKYSDSYAWQAFTKRKADRTALMTFLQWFAYGGNDENTMFKFVFNELLPQEPAFDSADILCISDFGWVPLGKDVQGLIAKAKAGGMKFYGLGVNIVSSKTMDICDSRWMWDGKECVEIDVG